MTDDSGCPVLWQAVKMCQGLLKRKSKHITLQFCKDKTFGSLWKSKSRDRVSVFEKPLGISVFWAIGYTDYASIYRFYSDVTTYGNGCLYCWGNHTCLSNIGCHAWRFSTGVGSSSVHQCKLFNDLLMCQFIWCFVGLFYKRWFVNTCFLNFLLSVFLI